MPMKFELFGSNFRLRRSLWRHQIEALDVASALLEQRSGRYLFQLPTGTGKGLLIWYIAYKWLAASNRHRALLVFPSEEVLRQFQREIDAECAIPYTIEKTSDVGQTYSRIVLASQNTLWNRIDKYEPDRLCIFDECHHENLNADRNTELLHRLGLVFGFSASPWSHGCEVVFDAINFVYSLSRAIAEGICAPYVIEPWPQDESPQRTHELFFCESNQAAQKLAMMTDSSDFLTYECRSDGTFHRKMQAFNGGSIKRMYCNRMLTEGFDDNRISSVYVGKETKSDILNYQMVGRALRFLPGKIARIYCATSECMSHIQGALNRAG